MKILFFFLIFQFFFIAAVVADVFNAPRTSLARTRTEHFFDIDKNGDINAYERGLINTYNRTRWRLARSRLQKKFDKNGDRMLDPREEIAYKKERDKNPASAPAVFIEHFNAALKKNH